MDKYCIWIVSPEGYSHSKCFNEVALSLSNAMRELGYACTITNYPIEGHTHITLGAHLLRPITMDELPQMIVYNLEQIVESSQWLTTGYLRILGHFPVWDYSQKNIDKLSQFGINAKHVPIGYSSALSKIIPSQKEDIDVLFYGSMNPRRWKIMQELMNLRMAAKQELPHFDINNQTTHITCARVITPNVVHAFDVYGVDLDRLISRSKVILNLHYYDDVQNFEIVRCSYLMANKKCIVSETGRDVDLETPYQDAIAFCEYDKIVGTCAKYIMNDEKRKNLEQGGFEIFSKNKQSEYLRRVL